MAAVVFIRNLQRNGPTLGSCSSILRSNGTKLPPQIRRAFAISSFKTSLVDSKSINLHNKSTSLNLLNKGPQVSAIVSRSSSSGDHVRLWTAEKALTAFLLGIIPVAVVMPSPTMETLLALSLTLHSHWGIEALVLDYVRPSMFGEKIPKLAVASVSGLSMLTFGSLCYFIWSDVGIITAISMLWTL